MQVDPYILTFSAITVVATIWMGFWAARKSKTASDFFVAGRSVSVGWNASAISGEYLSAASFMGVAGMVMSSGYDALWYPVCYACGYLFLLLFIAGPLRRFGAYTIPDFAEGRFDSPLFRKLAVIFVLFIGFFYTMPQMKGAGTTLAYIFPGLPYWAGVVLVGAVITLNVALGGMKGITLVQAFQYWLKMFAISVPIFVLMAAYGHYGKQMGANGAEGSGQVRQITIREALDEYATLTSRRVFDSSAAQLTDWDGYFGGRLTRYGVMNGPSLPTTDLRVARSLPPAERVVELWTKLNNAGVQLLPLGSEYVIARRGEQAESWLTFNGDKVSFVTGLPAHLDAQLPLREKAALAANRLIGKEAMSIRTSNWEMTKPQSLTNLISIFGSFGTPVYLSSDLVEMAVTFTTTNHLTLSGFYELLAATLATNHLDLVEREGAVWIAAKRHSLETAGGLRQPLPAKAPSDSTWLNPFGPLTTKAATAANLSPQQAKPLSLLYTYSLIIALVCGTAGLPHILVRFYTNPDGVAAKKTTMWVMILIGVFYLFPPVFGVMGRNLLPELYAATGAKGTDKVVLELPRLLNERVPMLGSILSGITCAGAFAAFMSTFSGLLVSMTGALAHDVYGRMLRPKSTSEQRMRMFKISAVLIGAVAIVLGMQVEPFQINFMVGQAFAIAAASYFPLLFMSVWWRKLTMKGAATGMLAGGVLALGGISVTSFSDLKWIELSAFWAAHPLLRILCEQPAIWAVPLAITLMVIVSKFTSREIPADVRMKMLVLHAPEQLGLKQEYIQEHQGH